MPIKQDTGLSKAKNSTLNIMREGFDLYTSPILYVGTLPLTMYYSTTLLPLHLGVLSALYLLKKE